MELVKRAGTAAGAGEQSDWLTWYVQQTGHQPHYSSVLEELASTQTERRSIIQGFLEPSEQDLQDGLKIPTAAHTAIAAMVKAGHIRVIMTTNFDRLMESSLRNIGIEPTVVSSVDSLIGAEPLVHSSCYILKIHGDYKDARIFNSDCELSNYPEPMNALLDRIIDEFGLIVAGWSGEWDHALRSAFMRAPARRYPTFWLSHAQPVSRGQELIHHRRAVVAFGDADSFFTGLRFKLETLQEAKQTDAMGLELTLAMAKRFMAKPEYRIRLDDLISAETRHALDQVAKLLGTGEPTPCPPFPDLVGSREAAAEPLARLGTILGRWGCGGEVDSMIEAIKSMYRVGQSYPRGSFHWQALNNYPAALVFYGYGLGLTRAGRWQDLHRLLNTLLVHEHYAERIGAVLAPFFFESDCAQGWAELAKPGSESPLCDRLVEVLLPRWASTFAGVQDPAVIYEHFEMACILSKVSLAEISRSELKEKLKMGNFHYLILGRLKWNGHSRSRLAVELSLDEYSVPLLNAGFANGDREYLATFVEGLEQPMQ
ncbi:hypothetical protein PS631_01715 [Pseudomonas fluorescens]|uniref:Uncharacterized protein n=1 Tax=Pseudomonas fluorescens TaxID=294 RepID=A0A5E6RLT4_PSEFL|nr:SIR2 family protein [Pseudomonas fluorescens]VVM69216.1 hypothetical protein PS631_01715 [Pseudomonas fluorescens]